MSANLQEIFNKFQQVAQQAAPVVQQAVTTQVQNVAQNVVNQNMTTTETLSQTTDTSIFDTSEEKEDKKTGKTSDKAGYDEQIAQLNAKGIKTTIVNGEADFSQYGAALSDELKEAVKIETEDELKIQEELAGLFQGKNVYQTNDFIAEAQALGYEVSSDWTQTTYIPDNKADGHYDTDVTNGAVNVLTIKDPQTGAEIKIVDANGNGAIESEELFMNQILEEVSINLDPSNFGQASGVSASGSSGSTDTSIMMTSEAIDNTAKEIDKLESEAIKEETKSKETSKSEETNETKKAKKARKQEVEDKKEELEAKEEELKSQKEEKLEEKELKEQEEMTEDYNNYLMDKYSSLLDEMSTSELNKAKEAIEKAAELYTEQNYKSEFAA